MPLTDILDGIVSSLKRVSESRYMWSRDKTRQDGKPTLESGVVGGPFLSTGGSGITPYRDVPIATTAMMRMTTKRVIHQSSFTCVLSGSATVSREVLIVSSQAASRLVHISVAPASPPLVSLTSYVYLPNHGAPVASTGLHLLPLCRHLESGIS